MPLQPDEKTLTHEISLLNIRYFSVINSINQLVFKRYSSSHDVYSYTYLNSTHNQFANSIFKDTRYRNNYTNALLKYDYYTAIAIVYNGSRMSVPIMIKEGNADVVSVEDAIPYNKSGVVTLFPGRKLKVHLDRLDNAQLERVRQYLNIYIYNIPGIALRTRWSVVYSLDSMLCLTNGVTHAGDSEFLETIVEEHDVDGLIKGSFDTLSISESLLCSSNRIISRSDSFFQSVYRQVQKITFNVSSMNFPDSVTARSVGFFIRMSLDGNLLFVSAPTSVNKRGDLRIYSRSGDVYNDIASLTGQDSAPGDYFGYHFSINVDGGILVVGSPHLENTSQVSQIYIYNNNGSGYNQIQQISDPTGVTNTEFGYQIHLSSDGDTLIVASPNYNSGVGVIYVYKLVFGTYGLVDTITAPAGGRFGEMMDLTGYTLAVAAPDEVVSGGTGRVYLYDVSGNGPYIISQIISAPVSGIDKFGRTMSFGIDKLFLGYPGMLTSAVYYYGLVLGSYVYDNNKSFSSLNQLFIEHADYDDYLFISSISGDAAGFADIYNYPDYATYAFAQSLRPNDSAAGQLFGKSIAVSSDAVRLAVGAPGDKFGEGAVYVYKRN